jgi:hypothetical protein
MIIGLLKTPLGIRTANPRIKQENFDKAKLAKELMP